MMILLTVKGDLISIHLLFIYCNDNSSTALRFVNFEWKLLPALGGRIEPGPLYSRSRATQCHQQRNRAGNCRWTAVNQNKRIEKAPLDRMLVVSRCKLHRGVAFLVRLSLWIPYVEILCKIWFRICCIETYAIRC